MIKIVSVLWQDSKLLENIMPFVLMGIGLAMFYWVNKRNFNRRNKYGVYEFKSYEGLVVARIISFIIAVIGAAFFVVGFFTLVL